MSDKSARKPVTRPIVGLGLAVVDHVYVVESFDPADRVRYQRRIESGGGMVSTALVQAAALGCRARILSLVGDDPDGGRVSRWLREARVSVRGLVVSPAHVTTVAVVLVDGTTAARRFFVAARRKLERTTPDFDLSAIRTGSILLVDGHFPAQARRAVRRAREVGATVIADFSHPRADFLKLLPYVDHPVVPMQFANAYAGPDPVATLRRLHTEHGAAPIVTLGERGGVYLHGGKVHRYAARRARVVDTTGAGDTFHGAFAAGLAHGFTFGAAVALAARAAAVCCTALGGRGRLLSVDDVAALRGRSRRS